MSSIPAAIRQALQAQQQSTAQKVDLAVVKKQLDVQKQTGDAINALLEQAVSVQKQIASGHLDVKL